MFLWLPSVQRPLRGVPTRFFDHLRDEGRVLLYLDRQAMAHAPQRPMYVLPGALILAQKESPRNMIPNIELAEPRVEMFRKALVHPRYSANALPRAIVTVAPRCHAEVRSFDFEHNVASIAP